MVGGASEFGGGILSALDLLNPLGPLGIIGVMAMAWRTAHKDKAIWVTEGGAELPLTNLSIAAAPILAGPNKNSLDHARGIRLPRWLALLGILAALYAVANAPESERQPGQGADEARERLTGEKA